ncbi:MAG: TolC family protein [Cyanobacteria bacterium]|nr:TolC family protein [Cyanobacteriota bacterium]
MKRFFLILFVTLALLGPPQALAEPETPLTLDQAMGIAIENNPQLKATQARLGISQAEIITAGARLNPAFVTDNGIAEGTTRVGIEQTFELGGKRKKRVALAQARQSVVSAEINTIFLDIRANVRRAYTQLFNAQERQRNYEEILRTTQKLLDVAKEREEAGDVARLDVLQARIVTISAKNELQTAAYQVTEARNRLNALLNQPLQSSVSLLPPGVTPQTVPPTKGISLQGSVIQAEADLNSLIETALTRRPELQQNLNSLTVAQRQLELAQANRVPNLNLTVGPDIVYRNPNNNVNQINAYAAASLELPVFNRQQGPIQEAIASRKQLELQQAALKNQITLEVTSAYTAFVSSRERVKRYETELLPEAQQIIDLSRESFQEGKSSILVPLSAQQAYQDTRTGYLQALMDYQTAISDLERAVGSGL